MKTAVVTSTSPYRKEMFDLTYPNMKEYCSRHGYIPIVIHLEDGVWAYKKHETFKDLFNKGYELIAYRDDDALFTNLSIPYESFIDNENDFFITRDVGGINGGSMILKNTKEGQFINDIILSQQGRMPNEQNAIEHLMREPEFNQFVKVLPQKTINAYRYDLYPEFKNRTDLETWREGDFILHLPALTIEKRIEIFKQTYVTG